MSDTARQLIPLIQVLLKASRKRRLAILDSLCKKETDGLCEIILNGLAGPAKRRLPPACIKRCQPYKKVTRTLAFGKRIPWRKRQALLKNQSGRGWFLPIIGAVLSELLSQ